MLLPLNRTETDGGAVVNLLLLAPARLGADGCSCSHGLQALQRALGCARLHLLGHVACYGQSLLPVLGRTPTPGRVWAVGAAPAGSVRAACSARPAGCRAPCRMLQHSPQVPLVL